MQCDDEQKMKIYSIYKKKIPIDRKSLAKHFMDAGKMLRAVHCRTYSTQLMWTLNIWHLTFLLKCSSQFQKNLSSLRFYFWASLKFLEPKFRVCDRWVFFFRRWRGLRICSVCWKLSHLTHSPFNRGRKRWWKQKRFYNVYQARSIWLKVLKWLCVKAYVRRYAYMRHKMTKKKKKKTNKNRRAPIKLRKEHFICQTKNVQSFYHNVQLFSAENAHFFLFAVLKRHVTTIERQFDWTKWNSSGCSSSIISRVLLNSFLFGQFSQFFV